MPKGITMLTKTRISESMTGHNIQYGSLYHPSTVEVFVNEWLDSSILLLVKSWVDLPGHHVSNISDISYTISSIEQKIKIVLRLDDNKKLQP